MAEVWDTNEKGIRISPLSPWQCIFSCPFALHGRSGCPRAIHVNACDEILWNISATMLPWQIPAHLLHTVIKGTLTLKSRGESHVEDGEWQADNALWWTGYSLSKWCHIRSFTTTQFQLVDRCRKASRTCGKPAEGKHSSECINSERRLPGVNVCNSVKVNQGNAGDEQQTGSVFYSRCRHYFINTESQWLTKYSTVLYRLDLAVWSDS